MLSKSLKGSIYKQAVQCINFVKQTELHQIFAKTSPLLLRKEQLPYYGMFLYRQQTFTVNFRL